MSNPIFDISNPLLTELDMEQLGLASEASMSEMMDSLQFNPNDVPMPWDAEGHIIALDILGTPDTDVQFWQHQTTAFTCAVVAQCDIIAAFTGMEVSEAQLVYDATVNGWLSDGGMSPSEVGNLLELYGISCHKQMGATIEDLMAEFAQGHKVIVGIDPGEIWNQDEPLENFFQQAADHAIWVTGVDMSDPTHPMVIVNDSGEPNGAGKAYDLSVFVDAWQDSGFFYVSTDHASPDYHLAATGFDPATGVFPDMVSYFGNIYDEFRDRVHGEDRDSMENNADVERAATFHHDKENVLQLVEGLIALAADLKEQPSVERIQPALRQYQIDLFRLVVVGEIKKGKSSFINALLGEPEVLPTASDVATSTVYKIMYGDTKAYKVFFFPKDPEKPVETTPPPLDITQEQLAEYGTEDGNPGNEKGVDFIGVKLPHPLLKSGVMIIDTPGLGGLFKEHSEITWRYVPSADAIFFVLDSLEAVASKAEMDYLQRLRKMTPLLFFVQTKIDLVKEEQWQSWRDRNLDIIAQTLEIPKEKLIYFPVSSELKRFADEDRSPKDLNRSGFTALLYFFHNKLLKAKEERLARALLQNISAETVGIRRRLNDGLQVLNTESRQALETFERELNETKTKFEKWRATQYPQLVRAFQNQSNDLKREALDSLQNQLDPSPAGPVIGPILTELRKDQCDARQLNENAGGIRSSCIDLCTQQVFTIQSQYNQQMKALIADTAQKLGQSFTEDIRLLVKGVSLAPTETLGMHLSGFETARNTFFGGTAGAAMITAVLSLFFPPMGVTVAIGQLAGFIAGYIYTKRHMEAKCKEEALAKLQSLLADTVRLALKQATQQFHTIARDFERAASDAFEGAASATHQELQARLTSIAEARNRTREENMAKATQLKKPLTQVDQLLRDIHQMLGTASPAAS